jgi:hypothetical protein
VFRLCGWKKIATPSTHLFEPLDLDAFIIQEDLDILDGTRHVVNPFHQQRFGIVIDFSHAEASQIRLEGDSSVLFTLLVVGDLHEQKSTTGQAEARCD